MSHESKPTFILLDATATAEEIVRAVRAAAGQRGGGGDDGGRTPAPGDLSGREGGSVTQQETRGGTARADASAEWDRFEAALAGALADMPHRRYVVIGDDRTTHFVQFVMERQGLLAETSSNTSLPPGFVHDAKHLEALAALGWKPPGGPGAPPESLNFYIRSPHPVPSREVARIARRTLEDVCGIPTPTGLTVKAWDHLVIDGQEPSDRTVSPEQLGFGWLAPRSQPPSEAASRSLLLERASQLTGRKPESLVDSDGDVQLRDSPFGIWARIANVQGEGTAAVVLVAIPLMELPASAEVRDLVKRTLAGGGVEWRLATNAVHLFRPLPVSVLAKVETFGEAVASMAAVAESVVEAVQPKLGGLTAEQQRVLAGWRGRDEGTEALLLEVAKKTGGRVLGHGWNPRSESPPLLVAEEDVPGGWANRFVTVDAEGELRFRSAVPRPRDGVPGYELTIQRLDAEAARTWATRLGVESRSGPLGIQEVRSLTGRRWTDLTAAFRDLPHDSGDGWQPAAES